ncbi:MAG: CNNM domain-containing protein [Planctomycetota bacterium]
MDDLVSLIPWLLTMAALIACSGFFSASEAALFYLQAADRRQMAKGTVSERAAATLLNNPDRLLSAVLFWNLVVNIAYFAISSICAIRMENSEVMGTSYAWGFAMLSLLAIIFCSEMLPKTVAVLKPRELATFLSIPLGVAVRIVDPLMPLLRSVNLISRRIIWPGFEPEPEIDVVDLEKAIALSGADEALIKQEQTVLQNIVQLSTIRVEEWMRPRNQFVSFQPPVQLEDLKGIVPHSGYLLITEPDGAEIERAIRLDNQFRFRQHEVDRIAEPVLYLPWCATVADALEKMSQKDREVTVVLNEFGETIGILTIEDILETVFAYSPSRTARLLDRPAIEQLEEGRWRVAGIMGLRLLAKRLDVEIPKTFSVTVRGVIQETLQRLAEPDDRCQWGPFKFHVVEMRQRGAMMVDVEVVSNSEWGD